MGSANVSPYDMVNLATNSARVGKEAFTGYTRVNTTSSGTQFTSVNSRFEI
mgnify:CR=1 FL=1